MMIRITYTTSNMIIKCNLIYQLTSVVGAEGSWTERLVTMGLMGMTGEKGTVATWTT